MALGIYEEEDIRALAEEIRTWKGGGSPMTVKEMKDEIQNVRESGFSDGWSDGHLIGKGEGREQGRAEGLEEGKTKAYAEVEPINAQLENTLNGTDTGGKSFYDEFWDAFLNNGARGSFSNAFRESGFEYIRPNRKIIVTGSVSSMFYNCPKLKKIESQYFNFSQVPRGEAGYVFTTCTNLEEIEDVGLQAMASYDTTFSWCSKLKTISKVRVDENTKFYNPFANLFELQHLIVEGVIGQNNFDVRASTKLSKASISSIINALSTTTSGLSVTLSKTAVETAFGSTESEEWILLINTRANWTINLV